LRAYDAYYHHNYFQEEQMALKSMQWYDRVVNKNNIGAPYLELCSNSTIRLKLKERCSTFSVFKQNNRISWVHTDSYKETILSIAVGKLIEASGEFYISNEGE
jgi:hypothetical protein